MAAIRVNSRLAGWVDFDPTKESTMKSVADLCALIESEDIVMPIFQTYVRWQIEKSIALLNFQLDGFAAVSPISINEIGGNPGDVGTQITFLERTEVPTEKIAHKWSVVDGQQRLTCNFKAYINHQDFRNIVFDLSKGEFLFIIEAPKDCQVPVGVLYYKDPSVLENYISHRTHLQSWKVTNILNRLRNKFMGYRYVVNLAHNLTQEQQLKWFEVLNLAGTKVTGVQVDLTEMLVKGVDFYAEYADQFLDRLKQADMDRLLVQKSTEISIPLAMLNPAIEVARGASVHKANFCPFPSDAKASLVSRLEVDKIRDTFAIALGGLDKALAFIEGNLEKPTRIDFVTYLAGAFMYIGDRADFDKGHLIRWYEGAKFENKSNTRRREMFDDLIRPYFKPDPDGNR